MIDIIHSHSISYKLFKEQDVNIEKIEWYWGGMHPVISPKIRFDKRKGHCVIFGRAVSTPIGTGYREVIFNWFNDYFSNIEKDNETIKVDILLDHFDMIENEVEILLNALAKRFEPNQINFKWYFEYDEDITQGEVREWLNKMFVYFHCDYEIKKWEELIQFKQSDFKRFVDI